MQVSRQTFERIDQNRDRQITKQEVLKFDVNADGQLSKQEAQQAGLNPQDLNTLNQVLEKAADLEPTEVLFQMPTQNKAQTIAAVQRIPPNSTSSSPQPVETNVSEMPSAAWIDGISDAGSPAPILSEGTQLAYVQPQKPENFPEVPEVERLKSLVAQFKTELGPNYQAWKAKAESTTNAEDAKILSRRVIERAYQVHQPQSFLNGTVAENFNALQETVDEAKLAVFDRSSGYGLGGVVVAGAVGTVIDITVPTSAWDLVPGGKLASKARKLMKAGLDKGEQFVRVQMSQMEWLKFSELLQKTPSKLPENTSVGQLKQLDRLVNVATQLKDLEQRILSPKLKSGLEEIGDIGKKHLDSLVKKSRDVSKLIERNPEKFDKIDGRFQNLMGDIREAEVGAALHQRGKKEGFKVERFGPMLELPDRTDVEVADIVLRHKSGGLTFVQVKAGNAGNISPNSSDYGKITSQIKNTFKYASQMEFQNGKSVFPSANARRPNISVMFCFDSVSQDVARFIQREAKKHPNVHFEFQRDFIFNRTIVGQ